MEKIRECWSGCSVAMKVLMVTAPILLIIITTAEVLLILQVMETDVLRAVVKVAMGVLWSLLGPVWWKNHRLISLSCFGLSLVHIAHAALLFLR